MGMTTQTKKTIRPLRPQIFAPVKAQIWIAGDETSADRQAYLAQYYSTPRARADTQETTMTTRTCPRCGHTTDRAICSSCGRVLDAETVERREVEARRRATAEARLQRREDDRDADY